MRPCDEKVSDEMSAIASKARTRKVETKVARDVMQRTSTSCVSANVVANDNTDPAAATLETGVFSDWDLPPFPGISWFGG
jgi:hypothetical protein